MNISTLMRILNILLATIILSCGASYVKTETKTEDSSVFNLDIQYGGEPQDKYQLRGQTDYRNFISAFNNFIWLEEIDKANENKGGCSPTLSVKNTTDERVLWVSMSGDRDNHNYLVGYVYPKQEKGMSGLATEKTLKWVEIFLTQDKQQVRDFFRLYFDKNYDQLHAELKKLKMSGEMEAPTP